MVVHMLFIIVVCRVLLYDYVKTSCSSIPIKQTEPQDYRQLDQEQL